MFDLFTRPEGTETTKGKIIGVGAGILVAAAFFAINSAVHAFSPTVAALFSLFFLIITTYEVRRRLASKPENKKDDEVEN